jgi:hypothetical protein
MVEIVRGEDLNYINQMIQLSAFPSHGSMGEIADRGMTLRDWFAGQALMGLVCSSEDVACENQKNPLPEQISWSEVIAKSAYRVADAMLKAREENGARP